MRRRPSEWAWLRVRRRRTGGAAREKLVERGGGARRETRFAEDQSGLHEGAKKRREVMERK